MEKWLRKMVVLAITGKRNKSSWSNSVNFFANREVACILSASDCFAPLCLIMYVIYFMYLSNNCDTRFVVIINVYIFF